MQGHSKAYNSILETIGRTPVVKLHRSVPSGKHQYFAKVEFFNPGGSVKDRIALAIIEQAEKRGDLKPGGTIVEATSGNTGVGLALVAAIKGYKCVITIPDKMSDEKINTLRAMGAKVIVTPTGVEPDDPRSHYSVAKKMTEITPGAYLANQYNNPDNVEVHYRVTGPEIWEQMEGNIDVFVAGAGTGGTISGVGRYLKEKNPNVKIVCVDPVGSILHDLFYFNEVRTPPAPYKIEGIGEDMLPDNVHFKVMDDFVYIEDRESFLMCRDLLAKDGLFVGPSAAGAVVGAIKYAEKSERPLRVLTLLPDGGARYLSKAFNDSWMKENGFLDSPLQLKTIGDLMKDMPPSQGLVSAKTSDTVISVIEKLKERGLSQLPVFQDKKLIGIVDEGDLLFPLASGRIKSQDPVLSFVKGRILTVQIEDPLQKLTELFSQGYVALVEDDKKELRIITKIDLIEFLGKNY
jgi:cystathionine beta-synthase